jgi:serine/threonine protein kinase
MLSVFLLFITALWNYASCIPIFKIPIEVIDDHNFLVVIDERLYECELPDQIVNIDNQRRLSNALCKEDIMLYKRCDDGESSVEVAPRQQPNIRPVVAAGRRSGRNNALVMPKNFPFMQFTFKKVLGRGSFGEISLGIDDKGTEWAIKNAIRGEKIDEKDILTATIRGNKLFGNDVIDGINPNNLAKSFVAMKYVPGRTVHHWIKALLKTNNFDVAEFFSKHIFSKDGMMDQLHAQLHARGFVHRDLHLHMANVMVREVDGKYIFEIVDFDSLARFVAQAESVHESLTTVMSLCFSIANTLARERATRVVLPRELEAFQRLFAKGNFNGLHLYRYTPPTGPPQLNSNLAWDVKVQFQICF